MNTTITTTFNPGPGVLEASDRGVKLNSEALLAERNGDLALAERLHLQAIEVKEGGPDKASLAISRNALGELYIKLNRLTEAEDNLRKAIDIRSSIASQAYDAAVSRENLGQLYELKGMLNEAREIRLVGAPDKICCGNYNCPGQTFKMDQLLQCGKCKSVYYCSKNCQGRDWKSRHKPLCT
ncbi:hypothetical protein BD779DRAFT_1485395 [Infundibulicybe gibba]|nr:hypothetical protein BD779DRAFT_1485395 [Infundibulicybe gibba]